MVHIFAYGSLMYDRVWASLVAGAYERVPGVLYGFERRCICNEHYPAIIPGKLTSSVDGVLYLNIDQADLARLDAFEGSYYKRRPVEIHTENNIYAGDAYILDPSYRYILSPEPWNPEQFEHEGIDDFISHYFGFDP